jgi:hypothetical protein
VTVRPLVSAAFDVFRRSYRRRLVESASGSQVFIQMVIGYNLTILQKRRKYSSLGLNLFWGGVMDFLQPWKASERVARRSGSCCAFLSVFFLAIEAPASGPAKADELQDFAAQCDAAVGTTVPDFDCDAGTEVPGQGNVFSGNQPGATCDEPNRLNKQCDPGSRFQVLVNSDSAYIVAHCRKEGGDQGMYGDIAVIQYGRKNGATCFYQALRDGSQSHGNMPGGSSAPGADSLPVKAPSNGQAGTLWIAPTAAASIGCGGCHDNGPFIRSPYLNGVTGPNMLPGSDDDTFNSTEPYAFVGAAFQNWKAYSVEVGNECNSCHRLGVSNIPVPDMAEKGTAMDFAIRATSDHEDSKNPTSSASPIWMERDPPQAQFDQQHADWAQAIHDCAAQFDPSNPTNLPDTDACRITLFAQAFVPSP